ncbi:hypothetical protein AC629_40405 [Bradyrhizobium sp. NAS80.1]|nr:hypothetical protein AC629_40405 [Bradyrhizobium sp. NAS80.1]
MVGVILAELPVRRELGFERLAFVRDNLAVVQRRAGLTFVTARKLAAISSRSTSFAVAVSTLRVIASASP